MTSEQKRCVVYDQTSNRSCCYYAGHGGKHNFARLDHDAGLERELRRELDEALAARDAYARLLESQAAVPYDADGLRARALEATAGPWCGPRITDAWPPGEWGVYAAEVDGDPIPHAIIARMERTPDSEHNREERLNAAFIAAANPQTIIALLDDLQQTRGALTEALDLFDATWCPEYGHAPKFAQLARVEVLRKMLSKKGQP